MIHKLPQAGWSLLLLLALLLFPVSTIDAQSGLPEFQTLLVELWPEYDRPEVLVIYRAELSPDTALPAQLTFRLPDYVETVNAVAVERDGSLFSVDEEAIELRHEGDNLLLTFPTTGRKIQLEYYDPVILTRQEQARQLDFDFSAPYDIETVTFEIQEPFQAEDFLLTPQPANTFTGSDGLQYNTVETTALAAGDTFKLTATYKRNTDELSTQSFADLSPEPATDITPTPDVSLNQNNILGYILVGAGALLLLGTGGYWWWTNRRKTTPAAAPRRPPARSTRRKKRPAARRDPAKEKGQSAVREPAPGFCYRCGTPLRPDASFCHACGAERRTE